MAIVLRRRNWRETDRILTILSPTLGRKNVVAKAVRSAKSKLASHLDLLTVSQIMLTEKEDLPTITSAEGRQVFSNFHTDYQRYRLACHMAKIIEKSTVEDLPQRELFILLTDGLTSLDNGEEIGKIWLFFLARLSLIQGVGQTKFVCQQCGKSLEQGAYWQEDGSNLYCAECLGSQVLGGRLNSNQIKLLKLSLTKSYGFIRQLNIQEQDLSPVEDYLLSCLADWLGDWRRSRYQLAHV